MPLLLQATPSFEQRWAAELEHDPIHLNDDGTRLHYLDASEFAVHLLSLSKARRFDEIEAASSVIERSTSKEMPMSESLRRSDTSKVCRTTPVTISTLTPRTSNASCCPRVVAGGMASTASGRDRPHRERSLVPGASQRAQTSPRHLRSIPGERAGHTAATEATHRHTRDIANRVHERAFRRASEIGTSCLVVHRRR